MVQRRKPVRTSDLACIISRANDSGYNNCLYAAYATGTTRLSKQSNFVLVMLLYFYNNFVMMAYSLTDNIYLPVIKRRNIVIMLLPFCY